MSLQHATPVRAGGGTGESLLESARDHSGTAALHRYLDVLATRDLPREKILSFFADMTAFNRYITPGISALASRLADELFEIAPYQAHGVASHILDASIDEYGLSGTKPHNVLLLEFGLFFGLTAEEINTRENAVPAATEMGEKMRQWYREAPFKAWFHPHHRRESYVQRRPDRRIARA